MDSEYDEEFRSLAVASIVGQELISFDIPLSKTHRDVWIAMDCWYQFSATIWKMEGELRFTKMGSPVLTVPITRGNNPGPGETTQPTTQAPGGSGRQPSIIFGNRTTSGIQTYVEIPACRFQVEAERVALFVKSISDTAGNSAFVAGLRIQSQ